MRGPFDRVEILERAHTPDEDILAHFNGAARPVVVRGYLAGTPLDGITFEDVRARAGALMLDPRWKPSHIYNTIDSSANDARISLDDYLAAAVLGETVRQDLYVRFRNLRVPLEFRNALGLLRRPSCVRTRCTCPASGWARRARAPTCTPTRRTISCCASSATSASGCIRPARCRTSRPNR
ncbi:hypothetical protein WJ968_05665 [Achromobacter xylosoxidans]